MNYELKYWNEKFWERFEGDEKWSEVPPQDIVSCILLQKGIIKNLNIAIEQLTWEI